MGRYGIFDIGYEDFGYPGGGLPQDRMDLAGVVGAGGAVAPQDVATSKKSLMTLLAASKYMPSQANLALYKNVEYGKPDLRLGTLVRRLTIVGVRKDPRVPMTFDDQLAADILDFQVLADLPTTPDGEVDATTWYALNHAAYLVGRGEALPLREIAGPPQTTVPKDAKQPTDNALNAQAAATTAGGSRLLVKTPAKSTSGAAATGSAAEHNQEVDKELSRKTKRDVSSLAGKAITPFRPSGVAFKKEEAKDGKVSLKPIAFGGAGILAVIVILILIFKPEWVGL